MSGWLVAVTGIIYFYICAEQAYKDNVPMALCYAGYAFANIGLYLAVSK
jgi:hypothetical protein|tara:strand:- start:750 stop:896 length:147 start_codon:yes stop_codon:yes gene_type:complete